MLLLMLLDKCRGGFYGSVSISFLFFKRICEVHPINWMWAIIAGHFKINGCEVKINEFSTLFTSLISDALV